MRQSVRSLAGRRSRRLAVFGAVIAAALATVVSVPAASSAAPAGTPKAGTNAATTTFQLRNRLTLQCLGTPYGNESVGVPVVQQSCDGSPTQRWTAEPAGSDFILHNVQTGACIDTTGTTSSAALFIWYCWGGSPHWRFSARSNGFVAFEYAPRAGLCADTLNNSRDPGAATVLWQCKNSSDHPDVDNQEWLQIF